MPTPPQGKRTSQISNKEGSTHISEGPHYSVANSIKDALMASAGKHITNLRPESLMREWYTLFSFAHGMLRGGSKKWAIAAHFVLSHLCEEHSNRAQRKTLGPCDFHEFTVTLERLKSMIKWDRGSWSDTPPGATAETLLANGPQALIGELLVQYLPNCSPDQARQLAASGNLHTIKQIKLPLSQLTIAGHINFHAAFADEASKVCSSGSSADFNDILKIYRDNLPIEIQDVIDTNAIGDAYQAYLRGNDSATLGLQVYSQKIRDALADPKRMASLAGRQQMAYLEAARSTRQLGVQRRGLMAPQSGMVAQLEHLDGWDGSETAETFAHQANLALTEGRLEEAQMMIAMMQGGPQQANSSVGKYDRRTPDAVCDGCGRSHPGGKELCFQVIGLDGAVLHGIRTDVGVRMARAAPILSSEICKWGSHPAWCFPGGPPADSCSLATRLRGMAGRGEIRVYSANCRASAEATPEQVDAYIVEMAGKLTPCTNTACINKRPPPGQTYPPGLRDCAVWKSGAANVVAAVQMIRQGMAKWSPSDRQATVACMDMEDQDLENASRYGTHSTGHSAICALTATHQVSTPPATDGDQHPPSTSPFCQAGGGTHG